MQIYLVFLCVHGSLQKKNEDPKKPRRPKAYIPLQSKINCGDVMRQRDSHLWDSDWGIWLRGRNRWKLRIILVILFAWVHPGGKFVLFLLRQSTFLMGTSRTCFYVERESWKNTFLHLLFLEYFRLKIINMPKQQILGRHVLNLFICVLDQAEERIEFSRTVWHWLFNKLSISHSQKMQLFQEKTKKNCLRKKM